MIRNIDSTGVARYPLGNLPLMEPATGATLIDARGRRSYTPSIAFGGVASPESRSAKRTFAMRPRTGGIRWIFLSFL